MRPYLNWIERLTTEEKVNVVLVGKVKYVPLAKLDIAFGYGPKGFGFKS